MPRAKIKHAHKFRMHKFSNKESTPIYFCTLPDCSFRVEVPLSLGKTCICNRCGAEFELTMDKLRQVLPHCDKCGRKKVMDIDGKYHFETPRVKPKPEVPASPEMVAVSENLIDQTVKDINSSIDVIINEMTSDDGDI